MLSPGNTFVQLSKVTGHRTLSREMGILPWSKWNFHAWIYFLREHSHFYFHDNPDLVNYVMQEYWAVFANGAIAPPDSESCDCSSRNLAVLQALTFAKPYRAGNTDSFRKRFERHKFDSGSQSLLTEARR